MLNIVLNGLKRLIKKSKKQLRGNSLKIFQRKWQELVAIFNLQNV